ncbi:hypothetical protein HK104_009643 [Borealophlyctis nickersoniae]|nr:hypothetical protein HK104_009643 [Borealophlyctis nickersoniae]
MEAVTNIASSAAGAAADAATKVHAASPATGTGTPLMTAVTWILYLEGAMIIAMALPYHVPYRREVLEWIKFSPRLWQVRVIIVCVCGFLMVLLGDTYLRLNRVVNQINLLQYQAANSGVTGGAPGAVPGAAPLDGTSHVTSTSELFAARFRGQRDFYVIGFALFCAQVLNQLMNLLIKLGKYRQERNEMRSKLYPSKYPPQQPSGIENVAQAVKEGVSSASQMVAAEVQDIKAKVDGLVHGQAAVAEGPVAPVQPVVESVTVRPVLTPVEPPAKVIEQRRGYAVVE